jgi:SAM-dependent methyltransferase
VIRVVGPEAEGRDAVWLLKRLERRAILEAEWSYAAEGGPLYRLWEPTDFLRESAEHLAPGRALDLACGTGRDAVFLASLGWEMTAIDVLPDALERGRDLERRYRAGGAPIHWLRVDLETGASQLAGQWDLVTMFRFLHRPLFARLPELLAPGGTVLMETFTTEHRARYGKPGQDAHVLRVGEARTLVGPLRVRHCSESWRGPVRTARLWAERADEKVRSKK